MTSIGGIDFSVSCPGICIHTSDDDEFSIDNCKFYYLISTKKFVGEFLAKKISGFHLEKDAYSADIERYSAVSDFAMDVLEANECKEIGLEDYAFAAKGQVFNIGENTGLLKFKLLTEGVTIHKYAPAAIKKFATGKGNANKDQMIAQFEKETGIDLFYQFRLDSRKAISPLSDICDSYYICMYHFYSGIRPKTELATI